MKRTLVLIFAAMAYLCAHSQHLNVSFDYATYMLSDKRSYVETYLLIDGKSVNYTLNDVNLESKIDITMVFKNADDMVEFRHFVVSNPPLPDTTDVFPDFSDVQRIFIPQGIYNFELKIKDLNAPDSLKKTISKHEIITIDIPQKQIAFSGIELLESFTPTLQKTINQKNNCECVPYCKYVLPAEVEYLRFYVELYNVAAELDGLGKCNIYTYIKDTKTQKTIAGHTSSTSVNALNHYQFLKELDVRKLPEGKYFLVIEIRDQYDRLCGTTSKYFERENPGISLPEYTPANKTLRSAAMYANIDTLSNIIANMKILADSAESAEIDKVIASSDMISMQELLYNFWIQRNQFDTDETLMEFTRRVKASDKKIYSDNQKEIMLKYGIPNTIVERHENVTPYEVWHYYKIGNLTNIKFVFMQESGHFSLLHSNMPCEVQNGNWMNILFGTQTPNQQDNELFKNL